MARLMIFVCMSYVSFFLPVLGVDLRCAICPNVVMEVVVGAGGGWWR